MKKLNLIGLLVLFALLGSVSAQTVPKLLPFQGRLTDQNGVAVSNGVRLVQFKIFAVPTGGSPLWAGELHRTTVNGGLVNVMLGSKTPFTGLDFDQQLYLEITVDINGDNTITAADPPMLPRQAILPVVFAKEAADSRKLAGYDWTAVFAEGTTNPATAKISGSRITDGSITDSKLVQGFFIPVGGVIMWWGTVASIPVNFELCDGSVPTTPGSTLAGNKPDLRDRFPKGAVAGTSDVKSSPLTGGSHTIAQRQSGGTAITIAQMPSHAHNINDPGHSHTVDAGTLSFKAGSGNQYIPNAAERSSTDTTGITVQNTGGGQAHDHTIAAHDNRPSFLELFFIIRVK